MSGRASAFPQQLWNTIWRVARAYHRYTVEGIEHLAPPGAKLVVGYHARPFAIDLCILTVELFERYGLRPRAVVHRGVGSVPILGWWHEGLGSVTADDDTMAQAIARGDPIVTAPGGTGEACRSWLDRYRVDWGDHVGYLRLALKYHLPIVPVAANGADDTYFALTDGPMLGRALGLPRDWQWLPWLGIGPLGVFPLSPPWPVRLRQRIGAPIHLERYGAIDPEDRAALHRVHHDVMAAVQGLLDDLRAGCTPTPTTRPRGKPSRWNAASTS